jgi:hypothetical protein
MHAFTEGNYYQYVSNPGTGAAYMGSVYSFVGARSLGVLYAKSDNEVWMFRRDDGDMVKYYHTTNGFTTYDSGYVVDVPAVLGATDASWVRVGAIGDPNGDPAVVVMQCHNASSGTTLNSGDGFYYYTWNGTTFDQHTITNEPGVAYDDRYFQFNRIGSVYHVMYFDNIANTMIHLTSEGDSTVVSTFAGDPIPARVNPTSTIVGDTMYLIWSVYDNTSIVMKRYSDGVWDADSTVIVASGAGYAMTVPNAEGLGYVPIWYDADGAGQVDFLRFYEQEAPTSWTAITSLPYTISTSNDTFYLEGSRLSSSTNGVTFSASVSGSVLWLGSDTLVFGTASGDGNTGVTFSRSGTSTASNGCEIYGGYIIHDPADSIAGNYNAADTICSGAEGVSLSGYNNKVINTQIDVRGHGVNYCVHAGSGVQTYNNELRNVNMYHRGYGYYRRDLYQASAVKIENAYSYGDPYLSTYSGTEADLYHIKMVKCSVMTAPHAATVFYGRNDGVDQWSYIKVWLDSNYINVNARNDDYTYPSGNIFYGTANAYGIVTTFLTGGSKIRWNTIRSGTEFTGGRGLYIGSMSWGTTGKTDTAEIAYNDIDIHQGPGAYYQNMDAHGMRIRQANIKNLWIHHNTVTANADNDPGTAHTSHLAQALRISPYQGVAENILIENNTFRAISTVNHEDSLCAAVAFDAYWCDPDAINPSTGEPFGEAYCGNVGPWGAEGMTFRNNHLYSSGNLVQIGYGNDGAWNVLMQGDTLEFLSTTYDPKTIVLGHEANNWKSTGNAVRDAVYISPAAHTDITVDGPSETNLKEVTIERTFEVYVQGNNSLPVVGATVTVTNNYGQTVVSGTTNDNGLVSDVVSIRYEGSNQPDSYSFNPHTIVASYAGDQTTVNSFTIDPTADGGDDTLTLASTTGTGSWTAPSLSALTLDSLHCDYSGETDSFRVDWTTPDNPLSDPSYIIFTYSDAGYQDSAYTTGRTVIPYVEGTSGTTYITWTGTETYTLYLSYWVYETEENQSTRGTESVTVTGDAAVADARRVNIQGAVKLTGAVTIQ